jgi:septum formation protein
VLLLASASPARRRLLQQAAIPHRVLVSGVDEDSIHDPDPQRLVQLLAQAKAKAVCAGLDDALIRWVLGCDSVLEFEGEVFGKPANAAEAIDRWRRMAGGWAELHTGHCLLTGPAAAGGSTDGRPIAERLTAERLTTERLTTVTTRVQFAALGERAIEAYVSTGEPLQCAGGFALEGRGGALVERIEGCVSNVIGLSLPLLRRWLEPEITDPAGC